MRYVLRADSSPIIGTGHVMRLSAIAEELISRGKKVTFVGQVTEVPWLSSKLNSLGLSQIIQSPEDFVSDSESDVLILDSYLIPTDDGFIQQHKWRRVIAFVDNLTPKYKADLFIHPGISAIWKSEPNVKMLSGPEYTPFRKTISKFDYSSIKNKSLEILVIGGGTDPFNFVEAMCLNLRSICGLFHARLFTNNPLLSEIDSRFSCFPIGAELDKYASLAELVFTTASTTSLEFIARGSAVGIGCAVENQEEYYKSLTKAGVAIPIGQFSDGKWKLDEQKILKLIHSRDYRVNLIKKSSGIFDLHGVTRITEEILKI